jgi:predicted TIM-barrel fold metal-dependent hydrolase
MPASKDEFAAYLPEPWRSRVFPGPETYHYSLAVGEYRPETRIGGGLPASDPSVVASHVLDEFGADYAVLLPLTRGLHPNANLATAICRATNEWLADRWLGSQGQTARFRGTIRIEPRDPEAAVAEIERWAGHPRMVQVAVPTQSLEPYGRPRFLPIWRAAARHGLPVVVHTDGGAGADFPPTAAGYLRLGVEYHTLAPLNYGFHLASLIAEGAFEWVDDLVFVFADGGFDLLWPLVWRMDKDWKGNRDEVPGAKRPPSEYAQTRVRFLAHRLEGPRDEREYKAWLRGLPEPADLLLFGSNYPHWDAWEPADARSRFPDDMRGAVMGGNAARLYSVASGEPLRGNQQGG